MSIPLPANINTSIIPYHGNWILTELASDTIFRLLPDLNMTHFMARTPAIHSMNPEIFLIFILFFSFSKENANFALILKKKICLCDSNEFILILH